MAVEIIQQPKQFNDWAGLLALLQQAFAYQAERIDPPSSLNRLDAQGLAGKAGEERLFLAIEDGQVIGCVFAKLRVDAVYVGKLAVLPSRQGQGIGRKLMRAAEVFANGVGRRILELETRIELTENHKTFAALGFSKVAEHAHAGYNRPTFIVMRKMLPHEQERTSE
jgi:GNAT superfamily N-acetyltransferase